ncbi:MAG: peptidoglycan DD-metalloendopeptidase family protein [Bacteroidetes bacterium]|nr:peptidoglycan DD-metalloendopeptidase family protein [Bacteroidota bacterium]MDA0874524.1 peptidoglycan DD-metalloendopeptidase family protein [Bacteroidota bacterium]
MRIPAFLLVLVLLCLPASRVGAQQLTDTEKKLQELRQEIAEEERLLEQAENQERRQQNRLADLNRQLSLREQLVRTYNVRIEQLIYERDSLQTAMGGLNQQLEALRREYRDRATHAYKYGRQHDAALILSASSINQMLVRVNYLRRFSQQRRDKLAGLQATTSTLTEKRTEMQRRLAETEVMLGSVDEEQGNLASTLDAVRREIRSIQQEKAVRTEAISEKRTMEQELVGQIRALITANAERPRTGNSDAALAALTASFSEARGLMPWPAQGRVTEPFGEIVHPEFGTRTPNPGILIASGASVEVMAAFGGRVSTIDIIPDMGRFAVIEHGGFHTVYGNLSLFYVSEGDRVEVGQLIGRSGTDAEPRGETVFFAVFKDGVPVDPLDWLVRR